MKIENEKEGDDLISFNDLRNGKFIPNDELEKLADRIVKFYNETKVDGQKTIDEIIVEVTK